MNKHLLHAVLASLLFVSSLAASEADRPNILWLTAEDICPNLGCYGDTYAVTPNLDRFAAQAVRYTQAFGITGVCAPNRSCLITGIFPSRLDSQGMRSTTVLPSGVKCFSQYLREAGYYCTNNAKTDYNFEVPNGAFDREMFGVDGPRAIGHPIPIRLTSCSHPGCA